MNLWTKIKIALSVIFGIAGALFFFILGLRSSQEKSDVEKESDKNKKKAKKLRKDTDKLLDDVEETKKRADRVTREIETRKERRDEKAKEYFSDL
jgi:septal ring factor EnvC (AmiA/AmiB activator)